MRKSKSLHIALVITVLLMSGCTISPPRQVDCDRIKDSRLVTLKFDALRNNQMVDWIKTQYQVQSSEITISEYDGDLITESFMWKTLGRSYSADFQNDRLIRVSMKWESPQPTGQDILSCFGSPSLYGASYMQDIETQVLGLSLWYPDQGIKIDTYRFGLVEKSQITSGNIKMGELIVVRPGKASQMVSDVTWEGHDTSVPNQVLQFLRPWPGRWQEVKIDNRVGR